MSAPTAGGTSSHGGIRKSRPILMYGKLETIASARTTTPANLAPAGAAGATSGANASAPAAIVVGTPQKNRPFFGETLNRANRIAAQTATRAHAGSSNALGTDPASQP